MIPKGYNDGIAARTRSRVKEEFKNWDDHVYSLDNLPSWIKMIPDSAQEIKHLDPPEDRDEKSTVMCNSSLVDDIAPEDSASVAAEDTEESKDKLVVKMPEKLKEVLSSQDSNWMVCPDLQPPFHPNQLFMDKMKVFRNLPNGYNIKEKKRSIFQLVTNNMPMKRKQRMMSARRYLPNYGKICVELCASKRIDSPASAVVNLDSVGIFRSILEVTSDLLALVIMYDGFGFVSSEGPHLFITPWDVAFLQTFNAIPSSTGTPQEHFDKACEMIDASVPDKNLAK